MTPPKRTTLSCPCPCPDLNHYPEEKLGDGADKTDCHSRWGQMNSGWREGSENLAKGFWGGLSLRGPRNVGGDIYKYLVVFHPLGSPIVFSALCPSKGDVLQREMNLGVR